MAPMHELVLPPAFAIAAAALLGLVVGSFLNVVVHRMPRGESVVWPGSHCPGCDRPLRAFENVPVLSWLLLRARCAGCHAPISPRYPAIEMLTGLLFALALWQIGPRPGVLVVLLFIALLVPAALIDAEHRIIPDEISLGGLVAGLLLVPAANVLEGASVGDAIAHSFVGALLGAGLLWIVGFAHARVSVALGRSFEHWPGEDAALPRPGELDYWVWFPGLGFGDVKLLAMIGAFLGPIGVMETIVASALLGLGVGLAVWIVTRDARTPFGFGPALAAGALAVALVPHAPMLGLLG